MPTTEPITPVRSRFAMRLPRLRWIGLVVGSGAVILTIFSALTKPEARLRRVVKNNESENLDQDDAHPGRLWPGMWLHDKSGNFRIHIFTDGRPETGVPGLIESLKHDDPGIRESAIRWLAAIGRPARAAIPALEVALADPDEQVRAAAVEAITQIDGMHARGR